MLAVFLFAPLASAFQVTDPRRVNPDALALKEFADRVEQYIELQKRLESELPRLDAREPDLATIEAHRKALAQALRAARREAKPLDVFGGAGKILRNVIREDRHERSVRDAYAAMQEVPIQSPPAVDAEYPEKLPLATLPPLILNRLPRLPDGLEYRFMGRHLILRDTKSNLIVDFIREAVPTIRK